MVYNEPPTKGTLMLIDSLIGESLRKRLGRTTKAGTLRSADISPMSSLFAVCDVRTTQSTRRIKYAKAFKNSGKRSNFGRGVCWIYDDDPVSYTHLRAHETRHDLVCRLLLEKKKKKPTWRPTAL